MAATLTALKIVGGKQLGVDRATSIRLGGRRYVRTRRYWAALSVDMTSKEVRRQSYPLT